MITKNGSRTDLKKIGTGTGSRKKNSDLETTSKKKYPDLQPNERNPVLDPPLEKMDLEPKSK